MVKLVVTINFVTNNNYWISSAYFSFFSFIGVWAFSSWVYKSFKIGKVAAVVLFIWPSFIFWSSGILKESVAVGLIYWIIAAYFKMVESKSFRMLIVLITAIYFLFLIKYYFAVVLLVVLVVYGIISTTPLHKKNYIQQSAAWVLILVTGMIAGGFLHPNLEPLNILEVIINNNQLFVALSSTSSVIQFIDTSSEWTWLLLNAPKALFAGLFMPLSLNRMSLAYSIVSIENWIIILLFIRGVYLLKSEDLKPKFNLLLAAVFYIIMLAVFLALSTPNLGTLSRYTVAFTPVFLVIIIISNKFGIQKLNISAG